MKSYISVVVATVERGLRVVTFCSIAIAGGIPSMESTSGLLIRPRNCLAYEDRLSEKRRCPSAYNVSKTSEDFPEPEMPVTTTSSSLGISRVRFLRLLTLAPLIEIFSFTSEFCNPILTPKNPHGTQAEAKEHKSHKGGQFGRLARLYRQHRRLHDYAYGSLLLNFCTGNLKLLRT